MKYKLLIKAQINKSLTLLWTLSRLSLPERLRVPPIAVEGYQQKQLHVEDIIS